MNGQHNPIERSAEFNYHLLRNALENFSKNIAELDAAEYQQAFAKAEKTFTLESLVIASPEAQAIVIPQTEVDSAVQAVSARYPEEADFIADLSNNGLDVVSLRSALYRELLFNAVMQSVSTQHPAVSDLDVHLFYEMNHERFEEPEQRSASHILITINADFPENARAAATARINEIAQKLDGRPNRFKDFAKRYSECPTAMDGGKLGTVKRGQLYAELETTLFNLEEKEISPVVESELGFHLLLCEKIKPAKRIPLSKAAPKIRETLELRGRRNCQKAWLAQLKERYSSQNAGTASTPSMPALT